MRAKFYKGDFVNVDRPRGAYGPRAHQHNHYALTVILSKEEYAQLQLELVAKIGNVS